MKLSEKSRRLLFCITGSFACFFASCSPLKSSPNEQKHQMELTLHEVQTNLDDLRHDFNCYQAELQILDGKIKHQESASAQLKQHYLEAQTTKLENISYRLDLLEKKLSETVLLQGNVSKDIQQITSNANEVCSALSQYKNRINELEKQLLSNNRRFNEIAKLKTTLEAIAKAMKHGCKVYKVRPGDSLEKIARMHGIKVDALKRLNSLDQDLIVIGQELKIPDSP